MVREDDFMLFGLLQWGERYGVETVRILDAPFVKVTLRQGKGGFLTGQTVRRAAKALRRQGVTRTVLPAGFPYREVLEKEGVFPVETKQLRCEIAADWVDQTLRGRGLALPETKVTVCAEALTAETVRTVTELSLRHRYVWLSVPRGGEVLARRLRREYGVSLQTFPGKDAEAVVQFGENAAQGSVVTLRLWDEAQALPSIILPPNQEQALPLGADRGQLIAALRRCGAVKHLSVGQI